MAGRYLLFIHGYEGTFQSYKGRCLRDYLAKYYSDVSLIIPQLACYPRPAWQQIEEIIENYQDKLAGIIGASMGGFMAAKASVISSLPAVLVNPLADLDQVRMLLGEHIHPHTKEQYCLTEKHFYQLKQLQVSPEQMSSRQWLLLQTGDEILDFRKALQAYPNTRQSVECGGNHGFVGFHRYVPAIIRFLLED
ncbi:MAG: hypothetical protein CENE_02435 [Candidatus Celerinatantimonas neptuna]|nr:MAG: hypothetical protein CENE_02435 [Candidatus Celerinatantimonas neptuna]